MSTLQPALNAASVASIPAVAAPATPNARMQAAFLAMLVRLAVVVALGAAAVFSGMFSRSPLLFWLQAISYRVTGSYKVGFLLPSLLAGLGTLWLIYDLGRRLWNRQAGGFM